MAKGGTVLILSLHPGFAIWPYASLRSNMDNHSRAGEPGCMLLDINGFCIIYMLCFAFVFTRVF